MIETDSLYRRISIRILPILFCCYLVNYVDRVNVSFAQLRISASLGIGPAAYGFGAGLFFIGYFFLQVPSNLFLQRIGARNCMSLILLLWGVVSASTAFVRNEWDFYVLRFLLGACEAGFFPGVILYLTWWYPASVRARVVAVFLTAIPVAGLLGGPVSGWILENVRGRGFQDWQWLFILEGAPCLLVALWVFRCLPDHPRDARWLAEADRRRLDAALQKEALQRAATGSSADSAAKAFLHPLVWRLCLLYFCTMMGLYGLTFWLPQVIQALGWSGTLQIGLLSAIPWLVAVVFMLLLGARSDRKQERRLHCAFAAAVGAAGFAFCGFARSGPVGLAAVSLAAAGIMGMMAVQWSLPSNLLGGSAAAAGIALVNSFGNLGGFVSPTLIGQITKTTGHQTWGLFTTAAILLFAAVLLGYSPSLEPGRVARNA
ncbi:MAG: MFS transporter [Candidatus Brocadiia bacterium]